MSSFKQLMKKKRILIGECILLRVQLLGLKLIRLFLLLSKNLKQKKCLLKVDEQEKLSLTLRIYCVNMCTMIASHVNLTL